VLVGQDSWYRQQTCCRRCVTYNHQQRLQRLAPGQQASRPCHPQEQQQQQQQGWWREGTKAVLTQAAANAQRSHQQLSSSSSQQWVV
jgi:hypothetical protein